MDAVSAEIIISRLFVARMNVWIVSELYRKPNMMCCALAFCGGDNEVITKQTWEILAARNMARRGWNRRSAKALALFEWNRFVV